MSPLRAGGSREPKRVAARDLLDPLASAAPGCGAAIRARRGLARRRYVHRGGPLPRLQELPVLQALQAAEEDVRCLQAQAAPRVDWPGAERPVARMSDDDLTIGGRRLSDVVREHFADELRRRLNAQAQVAVRMVTDEAERVGRAILAHEPDIERLELLARVVAHLRRLETGLDPSER